MDNCKNKDILESLENRLQDLEERIDGHSNEVKLQQNIISSLTLISDRLNNTILNSNTIGSKEKINSVNNQITSYEKYINDPSLLDKYEDDAQVKTEIILENEKRLRKQYAMLEKIILKEKIIESKFINDFDTFLPKLKKIRENSLRQQQETKRIQEETKNLLKVYNQLMCVVKDQLNTWEKKVSSIEKKKLNEENTIKSLEEID